MRVLILAPSMYESTLKGFDKNKNGFSLMITDIAKSLSKHDEVYVATYVIAQEQQCGSVTVVDHSAKRIFKNFRFRYLFEGISNALRYPVPLKLKLRYLYYSLNKQCVKDIISEVHPDFVSIHGIGQGTKMFIDVCRELSVKFSVTLHGLIGLDESVRANNHDRLFEKEFLKTAEKEGIPVSVISSGIKRRVIDTYGLKSGENIFVILNGVDINTVQPNDFTDVRALYGISSDKQLAICIGNISERKNQLQLLRSFELLPQSIRSKLAFLFVGNETDNGFFRALIHDKAYTDNFILCGFVPRNKLSCYYKSAFVNLFPSLSDGFGLPIIEGFVHGVPAVCFADLDAMEDIYCQEAMVLADNHSDEALAAAVISALNKTWDTKRISEWGNLFSLDRMAQNYHDFFEKGRA